MRNEGGPATGSPHATFPVGSVAGKNGPRGTSEAAVFNRILWLMASRLRGSSGIRKLPPRPSALKIPHRLAQCSHVNRRSNTNLCAAFPSRYLLAFRVSSTSHGPLSRQESSTCPSSTALRGCGASKSFSSQTDSCLPITPYISRNPANLSLYPLLTVMLRLVGRTAFT
jgi:hypothetical protein